jgi:cobyrinic acid a,c-diamide synthase
MLLSTPRLVVAGLAGDSGKTLVALGLARAYASRGLRVAPFKKGPDYIDAAWLGVAARSRGRNLDTYLMPPEAIGEGLARGIPADLLVAEGNRGLFDGFDAAGSHSTAELAKLLASPVVLVLDVTKMTRTAAAIVQGCAALDPEVNLAAVLLNRVGTARQERVVREAIRRISGPPVVGAIPRLEGDPLPGRHLGLVTAAEHPQREEAIERAAWAVKTHTDLDMLLDTARSAPAATFPERSPLCSGPPVRIGVFRDAALSFYYPENLEALEEAGAELVFVSPLHDGTLPDVDALYFGGGFPEVHVERLAGNHAMREAVRAAAARGMPVYAECGGLMFLARELIVGGASHPMAGVLDLVVEHGDRPDGHGYVEAEVDRPNRFFEPGTRLRGHEFHYSRVVGGADAAETALRLHRGRGVGAARDGLAKERVWASYLHLHALATPSWATSFVALARTYRQERAGERGPGRGSGRGSSGSPTGGAEESGPDDRKAHGVEQGGQRVAAAGT